MEFRLDPFPTWIFEVANLRLEKSLFLAHGTGALVVSLPHSMLDAARSASVLEVVTRELRTPFGLRTLSPKDPAYRGRYEGGPDARDRAYHQGPSGRGSSAPGWTPSSG